VARFEVSCDGGSFFERFSTSVVAFGLMVIDMYLLCVSDRFNIELQILTASVLDIRDLTSAIESPTKGDLYTCLITIATLKQSHNACTSSPVNHCKKSM
jgi:hypothetical protein